VVIPDTVNLSGSYDVKISVKKPEVKFNEVQMKLIVRNLKLSLDEDIDALKKLVCKKIKVSEKDFKNFRIVKESIDARKNLLSILSTL